MTTPVSPVDPGRALSPPERHAHQDGAPDAFSRLLASLADGNGETWDRHQDRSRQRVDAASSECVKDSACDSGDAHRDFRRDPPGGAPVLPWGGDPKINAIPTGYNVQTSAPPLCDDAALNAVRKMVRTLHEANSARRHGLVFTVTLEPFGEVRFHVAIRNDAVEVTAHVASRAAAGLLARALPRLRHELAAVGLALAGFEIAVGQHHPAGRSPTARPRGG